MDLPEDVMHYLHDADIRIRDAEWRQEQDEALGTIIHELEQGRLPEPQGHTILVHPRWLAIAALALIGGFIWLLVR